MFIRAYLRLTEQNKAHFNVTYMRKKKMQFPLYLQRSMKGDFARTSA